MPEDRDIRSDAGTLGPELGRRFLGLWESVGSWAGVEPARPLGLESFQSPPGDRRPPHAPLRVLLPRLQEVIFESPVAGRLRRGRSFVPALRQQRSGAALVRLLRHHLQEERVKEPSPSGLLPWGMYRLGRVDPERERA